MNLRVLSLFLCAFLASGLEASIVNKCKSLPPKTSIDLNCQVYETFWFIEDEVEKERGEFYIGHTSLKAAQAAPYESGLFQLWNEVPMYKTLSQNALETDFLTTTTCGVVLQNRDGALDVCLKHKASKKGKIIERLETRVESYGAIEIGKRKVTPIPIDEDWKKFVLACHAGKKQKVKIHCRKTYADWGGEEWRVYLSNNLIVQLKSYRLAGEKTVDQDKALRYPTEPQVTWRSSGRVFYTHYAQVEVSCKDVAALHVSRELLCKKLGSYPVYGYGNRKYVPRWRNLTEEQLRGDRLMR